MVEVLHEFPRRDAQTYECVRSIADSQARGEWETDEWFVGSRCIRAGANLLHGAPRISLRAAASGKASRLRFGRRQSRHRAPVPKNGRSPRRPVLGTNLSGRCKLPGLLFAN